MISEINRSRFQLIGRDQIAHALATGTMQTLGINENEKPRQSNGCRSKTRSERPRCNSTAVDLKPYEGGRLWPPPRASLPRLPPSSDGFVELRQRRRASLQDRMPRHCWRLQRPRRLWVTPLRRQRCQILLPRLQGGELLACRVFELETGIFDLRANPGAIRINILWLNNRNRLRVRAGTSRQRHCNQPNHACPHAPPLHSPVPILQSPGR